ncbi:DNA invertase Pin-like site-specific DNA recombinase [Croceicoccus sp. BE223]|nr:DNA invertase Pin-like site-specific DNA recombinase [Croceicoccus sp. BE223]
MDKDFNSLDAQREACAAYVLSQKHEGWVLHPDLYDDGGFTGGNMDRPGLQQLLDDVKAGRVDVVVVYKVDRLTRSLADFAKIVEVLDDAGASFVSVTQAFNTTNSMGRLTLNVLLSFAQFEREVISERIRDKVAASKARGMWMGGPVPLGYRVEDRKLVVVPGEAETVRGIMRRYLEAASVRELLVDLERAGIVSKKVTMRDGSIRGGIPFRRGALHHLLRNRIYVGETVHKGTRYPGQHDAIVDKDLFDAVQDKLAQRTVWQKSAIADGRSGRGAVSLLAGLIRDQHGRPMSPAHTRNHGKRYRYYASNRNDGSIEPAIRLPAGDLDDAVRKAVSQYLMNPSQTRTVAPSLTTDQLAGLTRSCTNLANRMEGMAVGDLREVLKQLECTAVLGDHRITVTLCGNQLLASAGLAGIDASSIELVISCCPSAHGHEPRLRLNPSIKPDAVMVDNLVQLIARAFSARDELLALSETAISAMPSAQRRHLERTARLSYLAPDIVTAILDGTHPRQVTARKLIRLSSLPLSWAEQRALLDFPAA